MASEIIFASLQDIFYFVLMIRRRILIRQSFLQDL